MHRMVPEDKWDLLENFSSHMSREISKREEKSTTNLSPDLHAPVLFSVYMVSKGVHDSNLIYIPFKLNLLTMLASRTFLVDMGYDGD